MTAVDNIISRDKTVFACDVMYSDGYVIPQVKRQNRERTER